MMTDKDPISVQEYIIVTLLKIITISNAFKLYTSCSDIKRISYEIKINYQIAFQVMLKKVENCASNVTHEVRFHYK